MFEPGELVRICEPSHFLFGQIVKLKALHKFGIRRYWTFDVSLNGKTCELQLSENDYEKIEAMVTSDEARPAK